MSNATLALRALIDGAASALAAGAASAASVRAPTQGAAPSQQRATPLQIQASGPYTCSHGELHSRLERRVCAA